MLDFAGPWTSALVIAAAALVVAALLLRYRAMERAGTPLPPGAGGARMVGTTGTIVVDHVPGQQRGQVHVLGEDWSLADAVEEPLPAGTPVRIERVTGTRLVVVPVEDDGEAGGTNGSARNDDVRT